MQLQLLFVNEISKKRIAYSSVSHMGFIIIGIGSITNIGLNGLILQILSHGFISANVGDFFIEKNCYIQTPRHFLFCSLFKYLINNKFRSTVQIYLAILFILEWRWQLKIRQLDMHVEDCVRKIFANKARIFLLEQDSLKLLSPIPVCRPTKHSFAVFQE